MGIDWFHTMNKLWVRLSLGFLLVVAVGIGVMALAVNRATQASFTGYVRRQNAANAGNDLIDRLEQYYSERDSWEGVEESLPLPGRGGGQGRGARFLVADASGQVAAATDPDQEGRLLTQSERTSRAIPLNAEGQIVGYLLQETPGAAALDTAAMQFLSEMRRWLLMTALGSVALALLLGICLAWQFTRPMRALAAAAGRMAQGDLDQRVSTTGAQEVVEMAEAFNTLFSELSRAEALRQRMTADIAHELRTPVSVIRGQLEAMLDGVLASDPEHIAVVYDQSLHLARLVDDLRTLTQAEAGRLPLSKDAHDPATLVERAEASFAPLAVDAGIALRSEVSADLPAVLVDADRIQQVFANLLSNALRHTSSGGEICLKATLSEGTMQFSVSNTGQGLTPEQAEHVFERFWRAETARERDTGGTGLGLAIAKSLVEAHGGRIWVESKSGEGAQFLFLLPYPEDTG